MITSLIYMLLLLLVPVAGIGLVVAALVRRPVPGTTPSPRLLPVMFVFAFAIPALLVGAASRHWLDYRVPHAFVYMPLLVSILLATGGLAVAPRQLRLLCAGGLILQLSFAVVALMLTTMAMLPD